MQPEPLRFLSSTTIAHTNTTKTTQLSRHHHDHHSTFIRHYQHHSEFNSPPTPSLPTTTTQTPTTATNTISTFPCMLWFLDNKICANELVFMNLIEFRWSSPSMCACVCNNACVWWMCVRAWLHVHVLVCMHNTCIRVRFMSSYSTSRHARVNIWLTWGKLRWLRTNSYKWRIPSSQEKNTTYDKTIQRFQWKFG